MGYGRQVCPIRRPIHHRRRNPRCQGGTPIAAPFQRLVHRAESRRRRRPRPIPDGRVGLLRFPQRLAPLPNHMDRGDWANPDFRPVRTGARRLRLFRRARRCHILAVRLVRKARGSSPRAAAPRSRALPQRVDAAQRSLHARCGLVQHLRRSAQPSEQAAQAGRGLRCGRSCVRRTSATRRDARVARQRFLRARRLIHGGARSRHVPADGVPFLRANEPRQRHGHDRRRGRRVGAHVRPRKLHKLQLRLRPRLHCGAGPVRGLRSCRHVARVLPFLCGKVLRQRRAVAAVLQLNDSRRRVRRRCLLDHALRGRAPHPTRHAPARRAFRGRKRSRLRLEDALGRAQEPALQVQALGALPALALAADGEFHQAQRRASYRLLAMHAPSAVAA